MPIKFRCEHCRQLLGISQSKAGELVDCPSCGRSVRVPALDGSTDSDASPKWDAKDESLLQALNSLAALTDEPSAEGSVRASFSAEPEDSQQLSSPPPAPEPVELPPLEKPVLLSEPDVREENPTSGDQHDATATATNPGRQASSITPMSQLAAISSPSVAQNSRVLPHQQVDSQRSAQVVSWPWAAVLILLSFGMGMVVNRIWMSPAHSDETLLSTEDSTDNDVSTSLEISDKQINTEVNRRQAVEGRITFRTPEGRTRPEEGSVVVLLPAYRKSSARLSIVGCRPADSEEDRMIAQAAIRALGGELVIVGEDGRYSGMLPRAGEYHILLLSRHLPREEDISLPPSVTSLLGEYFDRPQQLLGEVRYHIGEVNYRGEETEIWDFAFEQS